MFALLFRGGVLWGGVISKFCLLSPFTPSPPPPPPTFLSIKQLARKFLLFCLSFKSSQGVAAKEVKVEVNVGMELVTVNVVVHVVVVDCNALATPVPV